MTKRIVIGISGASGVTYGVRMLELLRETNFETHLIIGQGFGGVTLGGSLIRLVIGRSSSTELSRRRL